MSSKNDNHSTTGNIPDIVEMSFTQMEGQCYKCGAKGPLSNKCTNDVPRGQWYIDKIKVQDVQLTQAIGVCMSTDNDQSTIMGSIPATQGLRSCTMCTKQTQHYPLQPMQER